MTHTKTV